MTNFSETSTQGWEAVVEDGQTGTRESPDTIPPVSGRKSREQVPGHPACVNPAHLEIVTQRENMRRGINAHIVRTGRCKRGHEMSGDNLTPPGKNGKRECRTCRREGQRRRRAEAVAA